MSGINFNETTNKAYAVGGDDVSVADGGTGSSTASGARTALGLAIGTDVQAWDSDLDSWATKTAPSGTVVGTTDTQTLTNKSLVDASTSIVDDGDATKVLKFQASSITTGTTRTLTAQDVSGIIYVTGGTDVSVADGGTGLSTTPTAGQLLIGNGSGYTLATLTAGTNVSIDNSTPGAITINAALANATLDLNRTTVADTNYTAVAGDTIIGYTSLSVTRTVTLPTAASATAGKVYFIKDESGSASATVKIIIDGNGAETIDGSTTVEIIAAYGVSKIYSSGSAWFSL